MKWEIVVIKRKAKKIIWKYLIKNSRGKRSIIA
jgi:hypothetical protein